MLQLGYLRQSYKSLILQLRGLRQVSQFTEETSDKSHRLHRERKTSHKLKILGTYGVHEELKHVSLVTYSTSWGLEVGLTVSDAT
jgi:hypothetical protein